MERIGDETRLFSSLALECADITDGCDCNRGDGLVMGTRILVDDWFNPTVETYNHRPPANADIHFITNEQNKDNSNMNE